MEDFLTGKGDDSPQSLKQFLQDIFPLFPSNPREK